MMTRTTRIVAIATSPLVVVGLAFAVFGGGVATVPNTFSPGTTASSSQVNANFTALADQITANVPWRVSLPYSTYASLNGPNVSATQLRVVGTYTKHRADTDLILEWHGDGWISQPTDTGFFALQLRIDGNDDGTGANSGCYFRAPFNSGQAYAPTQVYFNGSTKAVFKNLPAGLHTVTIWARAANIGELRENPFTQDRSVFVEESPSR
jgi:hypothetical protein